MNFHLIPGVVAVAIKLGVENEALLAIVVFV
jgi:hypothetical protein